MKKHLQRRVKRHPVRLPVAELNGQPVQDTLVVDISSLGARLETTTPLAPRNPVEFVIAPPGGHGPLKLAGMVVWMRPRLDQPGRFQMGVQFYSPQWELESLVAQSGLTP